MFDPLHEMNKLREEINTMLKDFFEKPKFVNLRRNFTGLIQPISDIQETDREVVVELGMPGIDKKDIILTVKGDILEVRAEKKQEKKEEGKNLYQYERSYSGFYRALTLPSNVKAEDVTAEYKDGILTIKLPKSEKKKIPAKKIKVV